MSTVYGIILGLAAAILFFALVCRDIVPRDRIVPIVVNLLIALVSSVLSLAYGDSTFAFIVSFFTFFGLALLTLHQTCRLSKDRNEVVHQAVKSIESGQIAAESLLLIIQPLFPLQRNLPRALASRCGRIIRESQLQVPLLSHPRLSIERIAEAVSRLLRSPVAAVFPSFLIAICLIMLIGVALPQINAVVFKPSEFSNMRTDRDMLTTSLAALTEAGIPNRRLEDTRASYFVFRDSLEKLEMAKRGTVTARKYNRLRTSQFNATTKLASILATSDVRTVMRSDERQYLLSISATRALELASDPERQNIVKANAVTLGKICQSVTELEKSSIGSIRLQAGILRHKCAHLPPEK